jgi:hypothetical protein
VREAFEDAKDDAETEDDLPELDAEDLPDYEDLSPEGVEHGEPSNGAGEVTIDGGGGEA